MDLDPRTTRPLDLYRVLLHLIGPRPIAWISTISAAGVPNLAPFSFSSGVSTNPPAHLFCPANHADGRKKDTLVNVEATREYVCSVVPFSLRDAMNVTSADLPPDMNEFSQAHLTPVPSRIVTPAHVAESPASFECRVLQIIHLADGPLAGNVVIGEIVAVHIDDALLKNGTIDPTALDLIGRMGGTDYCRTTEKFSLARPTTY